MKTKFVYVLVSEESDYYYEMVSLSLYSLRLYHPADLVEVVMDEATHQRLVGKQATLLDEVTPVVVPIPPEYNTRQRSRYLKTRLRKIVKGDYLFLDCDTIVCEPLNDVDAFNVAIAMKPDGNRLELSDQGWIKTCIDAGLGKLENVPFFNSGIIYVKDVASTHELYEKWHYYWLISIRNNVFFDQPALCKAIAELDSPVSELSDSWNYSLSKLGTERNNKVKIFHYFTYINNGLRSLLFQYIRNNGTHNSVVDYLSRNPLRIGYEVFSINNERLLLFTFSDLLRVYDNTPKLFRFIESFSRSLMKPILTLSRIKNPLSR